MIIKPEENIDLTTMPYIDIGRPNITDEVYQDLWQRIHNYIKETEIKIIPNGQFYYIEKLLETNGRYMGGGYKYCFAFETEEEGKIFEKEVDRISEEWAVETKEIREENNRKQQEEWAEKARLSKEEKESTNKECKP